MTRSALNYDRDLVSARSGLEVFPPSKTTQADAESADINYIVRQFGLTGRMPEGVRIPSFQDFSEAVDDYQTAANAVRDAQASFLTIPAAIRARFHNDPQAFLEYCSKPEHLDSLREMGLAPPAPEPETPPVPPQGKATKSAAPAVDPTE